MFCALRRLPLILFFPYKLHLAYTVSEQFPFRYLNVSTCLNCLGLTLLPSSASGTVVVNKLTLSLTAADDGLTYTCQAFNSALQKAVRQSVTLRVNCKYTIA